jgi:hypothetical protein
MYLTAGEGAWMRNKLVYVVLAVVAADFGESDHRSRCKVATVTFTSRIPSTPQLGLGI